MAVYIARILFVAAVSLRTMVTPVTWLSSRSAFFGLKCFLERDLFRKPPLSTLEKIESEVSWRGFD